MRTGGGIPINAAVPDWTDRGRRRRSPSLRTPRDHITRASERRKFSSPFFFFCFLGEGRSSRSRKRTDGAGEGGDGGAAVEQEGRREHRGDEQRQHRVPRPPLPPPPPPPRGRGCRRRRRHGRHRSDHPPPVDRLRQAAAPEVAARRSVSLDRWRGEEEAVAAFYSKRCKLEIASSVFSFFFPKKKNKDNGNNNRKNRLQKKYNRKKTQLNG